MNNRPLDSTDLTWLARLARSLLREPHAADDLVQDTTIAALSAELPPDSGRRAWLGAVARRLAARHHRGEARRARRERESAPPAGLPDAAQLAERAEIAEQLSAAARELPEPFRRTILLRFLEGLSSEEIAGRDGKSADTVRWRVRRGLELLRQELVRRHDRDWSSWCVLLVPLAHMGGGAGLATAGTSGGFAGWVASWIAMKVSTLAATAALTLAGFLVWWTNTPESVPPPTASVDLTQAAMAAPAARSDGEALAAQTAMTSGRTAASTTVVTVAPKRAASDDLFGRLVDERGGAVAGATVYLLPAGGAAGDVRWQVVSDAFGAFRFDPGDRDASLDLGVAANGFLRRVVARAWPQRSGEELVLRLDRGRRVAGIVVDEQNQPVPGLDLLLHTHRAGIHHVSPSQMGLRSERARLGNSSSPYQQCRRVTDAKGQVEFYGLSAENLIVRSLDPQWTIDNPDVDDSDDGFVTWVARRRLGVRLTVVDRQTGRPLEVARATFRCDVTFADGTVEDFGQWVGRGRGGASFVFTEDLVGGLGDRVITRAVFYGKAGTKDTLVAWRAEPVANVRGATGVAEVRVEVDQFANGGLSAAPPPQATLELDVRYADGSPFSGRLAVGWQARSDLGHRREDSERAKRLANGRYRLEIVAGEVSLQVSDADAAGSLAPWAEVMRCEAGLTSVAFVTLPRGAAVRLPKPDGWRGTWYVHASWRPSPIEDWRGSWNYGTRKDELVLTALRPAEWRFQLRRDADGAVDVVHTAQLVYGVETIVDR